MKKQPTPNPRLYTIDLPGQAVETNNGDIANVAYNIHSIHFTVCMLPNYSIRDIKEELNALLPNIRKIKAGVNKFLNFAREVTDADTACTVIAVIDESIKALENSEKIYKRLNVSGKKPMVATYVSAYKKLSGLVPPLLALDAQAAAKTKADMLSKAKEKVEAGGWVFFIPAEKNGLYKTRPDDDATLIQIAVEPCTRLQVKEDGLVYYESIDQYSELDEEHYEYNRYRDDVTYRIAPDAGEPEEVSRSHGYLGSSD